MKKTLVLTTALCFAAGLAHADHYANIELDTVATQDLCMANARTALELLATANGETDPDISQGNWSTFGWDLTPLDADISIICPEIGGMVHPFATAHTSGDSGDPGDMIEGFAEIFNKL
jgi:hypothetical protein